MRVPGDRAGTVLVTGAGGRIGRVLALALCEAGWRIVLHYRHSKTGAEETAHSITDRGGQADIIDADLADHEAVLELIPRARALLGAPLMGLVNNASVFEEDHMGSLTLESLECHVQLNLRAPVFLTQGFAEALYKDRDDGLVPMMDIQNRRQGSVVHLLDQRLEKLNPQFFSYTLSKAALGIATKTMAQALAPDIRVNGIAPGPSLPNSRQSEQDFQKQVKATPLQTGSPPQALAEAVTYLMGATALTGQILFVDGGQRLIWKSADTWNLQE